MFDRILEEGDVYFRIVYPAKELSIERQNA